MKNEELAGAVKRYVNKVDEFVSSNYLTTNCVTKKKKPHYGGFLFFLFMLIGVLCGNAVL